MFNKSLYYDASLVIVNILDVLLGFVIALTIVVSFFLALSKSLVVVNYSIYNSVSPLKHGTVLFWNIKIFLTRLFLLFMFIFDCTINHRSKSTLIRSDSTIVGSRLYLKLIGLDLLLFFNITLICILFFILYLFIYIYHAVIFFVYWVYIDTAAWTALYDTITGRPEFLYETLLAESESVFHSQTNGTVLVSGLKTILEKNLFIVISVFILIPISLINIVSSIPVGGEYVFHKLKITSSQIRARIYLFFWIVLNPIIMPISVVIGIICKNNYFINNSPIMASPYKSAFKIFNYAVLIPILVIQVVVVCYLQAVIADFIFNIDHIYAHSDKSWIIKIMQFIFANIPYISLIIFTLYLIKCLASIIINSTSYFKLILFKR